VIRIVRANKGTSTHLRSLSQSMQAQQTGMITFRYSYVISSLDMHSIDLEEFKYAKANIYYLKATNENNKELLYKHHWQCSISNCAHRPYMNTYLKVSQPGKPVRQIDPDRLFISDSFALHSHRHLPP
jgi:hypothetical protein